MLIGELTVAPFCVSLNASEFVIKHLRHYIIDVLATFIRFTDLMPCMYAFVHEIVYLMDGNLLNFQNHLHIRKTCQAAYRSYQIEKGSYMKR